MAAKQATRAKTERKPKLRTTRKPKPKTKAEANGPADNRDFAAELEALVHLTGGDFTPFIEIAKTDVGFIHEPDSLAAVNTLKGLEYARFVARLKKETKVRIAPFEAALAAAKGNGAGGGDDGMPGKPLTFDIIEPWPDQVDGEKLLTELSGAIGAYVIMDAEQRDAVALWPVFTHTHDLRDFAPLLIAKSAIKRSGKSRLAEIMERLAPRPLYIAGLTTAFIERAIEDHHPTLIIDEADRIRKGDQALAERIDAQFNRSFRRAIAKVGKDVPLPGGGYEPRVFSTWAATFIAGIGKQADTAEDRAVVIVLKRKLSSEKVLPLRANDGAELVVLARKIARFVTDNETQLRTREPAALEVDNDRAKDVWEPLLAIAEMAGGVWPARARKAGQTLAGEVEEEEEEFTVRLLSDIRELFLSEFPDSYSGHEAGAVGRPDDGPRLGSANIVKKLLALEDRPYGALGRAQKPLTQHGLGRTLKDFKIRPTTVRPLNETKAAKGYYLYQFEDVFARYLPRPQKASDPTNPPTPPNPIRKTVTNTTKPGENEDFNPLQIDDLLRFENAGNPRYSGICNGVTDQNAGNRDGKGNDGVFEDEL
jgi:putative DNA primase/helicase